MFKSLHLARTVGVLAGVCTVVAFAATSACADGSLSDLRKASNGGPMGLGAGRGEMVLFDAVVQRYNASRERFRIDGHCQSACTIFLSIRNVCITPGASLLFHAGGDRGTGIISANATQHMLAAYKPALRRYVMANHYMDTLEFHTISGSEMISRFGYPACR